MRNTNKLHRGASPISGGKIGRRRAGDLARPDPAPPPEKSIGVVILRAKYKNCGKENCGRCPHGPFWYAFIPWWGAKARNGAHGGRVELYLGGELDDRALLAKVAPQLRPDAREAFERLVKLSIDRAALAKLEGEWRAIGDKLSDLEVNYVRAIESYQKAKRANEKEQAAARARIETAEGTL